MALASHLDPVRMMLKPSPLAGLSPSSPALLRLLASASWPPARSSEPRQEHGLAGRVATRPVNGLLELTLDEARTLEALSLRLRRVPRQL